MSEEDLLLAEIFKTNGQLLLGLLQQQQQQQQRTTP